MATVFSTAYAGTGESLSSTYYMRRFYRSNANARTATSRRQYSNSELSNADAVALRRAIKALGSFTYDDDHATNIRNSVSAFIDTYNNLLSSAGSSDDRKMTQSYKAMKKLTSEYKDSLDKIGITVNKDGTLSSRTSLFANADISKFEKLFSKDADYIQRATAYTKRIERRSDTLDIEEKKAALLAQQQKQATSTATSSLAASLIPSTGLPADSTGSNINVVL